MIMIMVENAVIVSIVFLFMFILLPSCDVSLYTHNKKMLIAHIIIIH